MIGKLWRGVVDYADSIGKIGAAVVALIAGASAVPWLDGQVKRGTGALFGVKGAVYYEVGPGGDAMFVSPRCKAKSENGNDNECKALLDMGKTCQNANTEQRKTLQCGVDGGLFLLRDGNRSYCNLRPGDVLQAGTDKNFRSLDGPTGKLDKNPKIFVLRRGECVVVLEPLVEKHPTYASSGGWLKVATTACGLFR